MKRRQFVMLLGGAATLAVGTPVVAQEWPTRSILVVSPFATGTTYDLVARLVLDQVTRQIGQPFVVENRPGGGGSVGVASVVKAPPDGYTLLLSSSSMSTAVILHKSLPYDALRDLAPVALLGGEPSILLAAPGKNYSSVDDLVAAAKTNPGKLKFASVGIGSASHLAGERFRLVAGLMVRAAAGWRGMFLMSGLPKHSHDWRGRLLDFYFVPIVPALPLGAQGKAIPLAVSTTIRWPALPDLPTLAEMGYPISTFLTWCGLSAPAKTPHPIIDKLNDAIGDVLDLPAIKFKFERIGFKPEQMDPEEYGKFFADDVATTIELGKEAHIQPLD